MWGVSKWWKNFLFLGEMGHQQNLIFKVIDTNFLGQLARAPDKHPSAACYSVALIWNKNAMTY